MLKNVIYLNLFKFIFIILFVKILLLRIKLCIYCHMFKVFIFKGNKSLDSFEIYNPLCLDSFKNPLVLP